VKLDCIITLASPEVRLRFLAMERSLRATGCALPLRVIPYRDSRFDLPPNADWWLDAEIAAWLKQWNAHPTMRKYQCLTRANFHFVDADVVFLRDPSEALQPVSGFVTSCGHWKNPNETLTAQSFPIISASSTNWQTRVFNTGQWACDRALYTFAELKSRCESAGFSETCLTFPFHEQPGVNLLVHASGVPITHLTLPPSSMESTWAGDYSGADYESFWSDPARRPYLIHWAGCDMAKPRPIDRLMDYFLSSTELHEWQEATARRSAAALAKSRTFRQRLSRWKMGTAALLRALRHS
jgi:hypothetical protein